MGLLYPLDINFNHRKYAESFTELIMSPIAGTWEKILSMRVWMVYTKSSDLDSVLFIQQYDVGYNWVHLGLNFPNNNEEAELANA